MDNPGVVSMMREGPDRLQIDFLDPTRIVSIYGVLMDTKGYSLIGYFPKQVIPDQIKVVVSEAIAVVVTSGVSGTFFLNSVLQMVLSRILGILDNLSIIMHMFLTDVTYPAIIEDFMRSIFPLVALDFFHFDRLNSVVFGFD